MVSPLVVVYCISRWEHMAEKSYSSLGQNIKERKKKGLRSQ
jgi:hypothetical protein